MISGSSPHPSQGCGEEPPPSTTRYPCHGRWQEYGADAVGGGRTCGYGPARPANLHLAADAPEVGGFPHGCAPAVVGTPSRDGQAETARDNYPPATLPPLDVPPGQATKYCWSTSAATVLVLSAGQFSRAVSTALVVTEPCLILPSPAPCRPVEDVVDRGGTAVGEPGDQASDFGEAEVDELGGSVSALSAFSSRARRTVRQAWAAMARVMWRCQPG